jgi:hypothetical protein
MTATQQARREHRRPSGGDRRSASCGTPASAATSGSRAGTTASLARSADPTGRTTPRIWVGAYRPRGLRLLARKADGWLSSLPYIERH